MFYPFKRPGPDLEERVTYYPNNTFRWALIQVDKKADASWILYFNTNEHSELGIRASQGSNITLPVYLPKNWELMT